MSWLEDVQQVKPEIERLAQQFGATELRLFGSVVRGEERPDSDIDFLVTMLPGHGLLDQGGLLMALSDLLQRPVDVFTEQSLKADIRQTALREARWL